MRGLRGRAAAETKRAAFAALRCIRHGFSDAIRLFATAATKTPPSGEPQGRCAVIHHAISKVAGFARTYMSNKRCKLQNIWRFPAVWVRAFSRNSETFYL